VHVSKGGEGAGDPRKIGHHVTVPPRGR
jgi:hypothetical protein